jgi:hypothetical protein
LIEFVSISTKPHPKFSQIPIVRSKRFSEISLGTIMAPIPPEPQVNSFVLDENGNLDFTDLEEEHAFPYEEGFDSVILVDNCPIVKEDEKKGKLINYLRRTFSAHGRIKDDGIYMPEGEDGNLVSHGYALQGG